MTAANNKLIRRKQMSKRTSVCESQAKLLALTIRELERAAAPDFLRPTPDDWEQDERFRELPEYRRFHQAAYACGFVCNDMAPSFVLDDVVENPERQLRSISFSRLRQYVHTLLRGEAHAIFPESQILRALQAGALAVVAERLESDESLYEPL